MNMEETLKLEAFVLADNRVEVLDKLPEDSSIKRYLRYSKLINDPDFLQKIQDDKQLTIDQHKSLQVLHWLKCLELNKEVKITSEMISKDLGLVFDFSPPKELRSTLKSSYPSVLNNENLVIPYKILCDKGINSKARRYYLRTVKELLSVAEIESKLNLIHHFLIKMWSYKLGQLLST